MSSRRGTLLLELLAVTVLGALVLVATYRALVAKDLTGDGGGSPGEAALDGALAVLEADLREAASAGDAAIGGSDIRAASAGSLTFRAQRKIGFVCSQPAAGAVVVRSAGEPFAPGDRLLMFVESDSLDFRDDRWDTTSVATAVPVEDPVCDQRLALDPGDLAGVAPGAPVRSYEWVRYGIFHLGENGWALGREAADGSVAMIAAGLAGPGEGLVFEYLDAAGEPTADVSRISRVRATLRSASRPDATVLERSTNIYLRNN